MKLRTTLAITALIGSAAVSHAALTIGDIISVNFAGVGSTPSGAAVIGAVGNTWNDIRGSLPNSFALNEVDGSSSGVSLTVSAGSFNSSNPYTGENLAVFESNIYLDKTGVWGDTGPSTITLTGLGAGTTVDLYIYSSAGHKIGEDGQFVFGGTTKTVTAANDRETAYNEGVNYVKFATLVADGTGRISGTWTDIGDQASGLNGMQLQVVPEPSAALLGGLGILALLRRRR